MGRVYEAPFKDIAVTAAQDLWEVLVATDSLVRLLAMDLSQRSKLSNELLRLTMRRITGAPTSGTGGGTITPTAVCPGDAAFGGTVERNNTTRLSGGTATDLWDKDWNVVLDLELVFPDKRIYEFAPGTYLVVGLETAPGASMNMSGVLTLEELGG